MLFLSKYLYQLILLTIFIYPLVLQSDSFIEEQKRGWESAGNEILIDASPERLHKVFLRYGNWTGPGLSGGLEDPIKIGLKPPVDSLDEASMRHDFAYLIAQKQGAIYGADEEERLKSLADKILLKELRALPKDPRKWKHPPKGSVNYKAITDFKNRMITVFTLTEKGQKYITSPYEKAKRIQIDSKKDGTITTIYKELITDQKQKLTESDLQRHVKTLTKDWKNHADFTNEIKDSDLTKAQEKELYEIYRKDPQGFQKNYTSYKNRHAVPKSKAQIQQDKRTAAVAKKYNVYPEDLKKFLNCVCRDSGGSLGGHYDPKNGQPCIASGPLSSWPSPIKASKSHMLSCRNWLDAEQYKKDMKIFDEMRASDAQIAKKREQYEEKEYQKLLKIIQAENAKAVEEELQEVKQLSQQNETLKEAAELFSSIMGQLYPKDRNPLEKELIKKLSLSAHPDITTGKIRSAIQTLTLAKDLSTEKSFDREQLNTKISNLQAWKERWDEIKKDTFPQIKDNIYNNQVISAKKELKLIDPTILGAPWSSQGLACTQAPEYLSLKEAVAQKELEYRTVASKVQADAKKMMNEREPQSAIDLLTDFLNSWEQNAYTQAHYEKLLSQAKGLLKHAQDFENAGDKHSKKADYTSALREYSSSLSIRNSTSVERKLDNLYKRHDIAMKYKAAADKTIKDGHFTKKELLKAIGQYEQSVKYWPDKNLQNLINRLKQKLEQEKRKAELEAKIAKLEREKARQEEEAMTSAGLDFGNRFGARESRRTEQVQEKQNRDVYAGNSERADDQEEMLKRLKQGLEKMKSIDKVSIKPVHTASLPPNATVSSSHIPSTTVQPSDSSSTSSNKKFKTNNISTVYNNPKKPTIFIIKSTCKLNSITNYHWNNARGSTPGTIAVRDQNGKIYGPWRTTGSPGQGGVPNANWTANPNITLSEGVYTVIDSEPSTWAQNSESGYRGMSDIKSNCNIYEPDPNSSPVVTPTKLSGTFKGIWYSTDKGEKISGTVSIQLTGTKTIHVQYFGDDEDKFDALIDTNGNINIKDDDNGQTVFSGKITRSSNGQLQGSGRWNVLDRHGIWKNKTSAQATKPVSTPAQNTSTSNTVRDGLYTGTYTDEHLNTRNKKCQNHSGKLSVIVKGNRFSGDGSGTIDATGHLKGTFNNGYKANGAYFPNLKHNGVQIYDVIMGLISGPPYCTAALDLRKDRSGNKTYTPTKATTAPKTTPKWVLINTIIYTEPKNRSSSYDTSLQLKDGSFKYKIAPKKNLNDAFSAEGVWHGVPRVMIPNQNYNIDMSIKRLSTTNNYAFDTHIRLVMDRYNIGCGAATSSRVYLSKGDTKVGWRKSDQTFKSWRGSFKAPELGAHGSRSSKKIQIQAYTVGGCVRYIYEWKE